MKKKIIKLNEKDIERLVEKIIKEENDLDTTTIPNEINEVDYSNNYLPGNPHPLNLPTREELLNMVVKNTKDIEDLKSFINFKLSK